MPQPEAIKPEEIKLISKAVGPLPVINRFLERLRIPILLEQFIPCHDKRLRLPPALGIGLLLRNILVVREPLYKLSEWGNRYDESLLGLSPGSLQALNDDRLGRCLDALFEADRAALMTDLVVHAVHAFDLDLSELHNDSTTVTFNGLYPTAKGEPHHGTPTHRITFGHNKDHRPDLKQLLYVLTTTADGTVPVWCSVDHGNTTDDATHRTTWDALHRLVGSPEFLYVADSKLCTRENLEHIAAQGGRFVTVLPKTRSEDTWFRDWIQSHEAPWVELLRQKNSRRKDGPDEIYFGFESPLASVEGYRIFWILSSQKKEQDRQIRQDRMRRAHEELEQIRIRMHSPRSRLVTKAKVEEAVREALVKTHAERWLMTEVLSVEEPHFSQSKPGRPGKKTQYIRRNHCRLELRWHSNIVALEYDGRTDGLFPLMVNDKSLSPREALVAYKHQPTLEKRHEQFKSVLEVMPVFLKNHTRIEALLFIYFLALLVEALIERELRRNMKQQKLPSLPLYPESRACESPTTQRVFSLLDDIRRHRLMGPGSTVHQRFYDELTPLQRTLLGLLGLSPAEYLHANEPVSE